ncbi:ABC transporter permease [Xylophilus sp. ASV27]|uniref:ABC transporter permease n=1 Tax=Xylophilus sp. ASV27 TaxID=2795129 RepID=UPI0018EC1EB0|nr:ABC transporter permease [Xylophilus sp. ASV27]
MVRAFNLIRPLVFPAALLLLLEGWARTAGQGSDAIAPPTSALRAFVSSISNGSLFVATGFTLGSAALGLLIGSALGISLGTVLGLSTRAARVGSLTIQMLRPVPSVALIPLAMLVFGFGPGMEVSVVGFATFWPMLVLTQAATRQVDPQLLEVARALQLSPLKRFVSIVLPSSVPRLFVALRLGAAIALVVAVTVEIAANPHGMGYALMVAQQSLDPALMLSWLFWIGMVGFAVNAGTLRLQRWVARRMGEAQP